MGALPDVRLNPNIYGESLSLNVGRDDNSIDYELAKCDVCEYFWNQ